VDGAALDAAAILLGEKHSPVVGSVDLREPTAAAKYVAAIGPEADLQTRVT
jgi:hypothetical protein